MDQAQQTEKKKKIAFPDAKFYAKHFEKQKQKKN